MRFWKRRMEECALLLAMLVCLADNSLAQNTFFAGNPGDMIYRGTSAWQRVPGGTAGQLLQSNGPTAAPTWTWGFGTYTTSPFVLPAIATNRALMNVTGGNAAPTAGTQSQFLDTIGYDTLRPPATGAMVYKDGTTGTWQATTGSPSAGYVMTMQTNGVPAWLSAAQGPLISLCTTTGAVPVYSGTAWVCSTANTATNSAYVNTTNPTLTIPNTPFSPASQNVGIALGAIATWQTGGTQKDATISAQSIIEATAPATGAAGALYGGTVNKLDGTDAYGVLGIMRNTSAVTTPTGAAVWAIIPPGTTGDKAGSSVNAFRATSEIETQNPGAGLQIINTRSDNAFTNGVLIESAVTYGYRIGLTLAEGAANANVITPTNPFAFLTKAGAKPWFVDATGNQTAATYKIGANTFADVAGNFTEMKSADGAGILSLGTTTAGNAIQGSYFEARNEAGNVNYVRLGPSGVSIYGSGSGSILLAVQVAAGTPTVTFGTSSGTPAVTASSPLAITSATGNITCATCATTAGASIPSLATGDILYASAANTLSALADVAVLNVLISGGVGVAPSWGKVALGALATQATNTVVGNATSGSAAPTALAVGTCSTSASALIWTTNTGFGCNTSINAATLGGATFAAPGAIGGGTPSTIVATTVTANSFIPNSATIPTNGLYLPAANTVALATNSTQALRIDSSQRVGIGSNPGTQMLLITAAAGIDPIKLSNTDAGSFAQMLITASAQQFQFGVGGASAPLGAASAFFIYDSTQAAMRVIMSTTGNFAIQQTLSVVTMGSDTAQTDNTVCINSAGLTLKGTGALGICLGTSGAQFKTAFAPMQAGLKELMQIGFLNYRYKRGYGDDGARMQYGPTAQNVGEAIPDLVGKDASGDVINYDSGALFFIGLRAIQELKVANDNLRAEVDDLKRKVAR